MKRCPGNEGDGCQNQTPDYLPRCAGCKLKADQQEAAVALWANGGLKALEEYLGWWAVFESRYGPN